MKRKIKFIYLILGFIILPCVSGIFSQTIETREPNQCGLITDGIEFCIETPLVSVEEGKDVFITYSMKNITNEEITTRFGRNSGQGFPIKLENKVINSYFLE